MIGIAQDNLGGSLGHAKYPNFTPGAGYEMAFSLANAPSARAITYAVPIELRLLSVENTFTLALGERLAFTRMRHDETNYLPTTHCDVDRYRCELHAPYLDFDQFSTYLAARYNIVPCSDTNRFGLFVGAAYLFDINANGKVYIDIPSQGPFPRNSLINTYEWGTGLGWQPYRSEQLFKGTSHTLRFEAGFATPGVEFSIFLMMGLTSPYDLDRAAQPFYYDRNHENTQLSAQRVTHPDGKTSYLPITLTDYVNITEALSTRTSLGFTLKFYLVPKYFRNVFKR